MKKQLPKRLEVPQENTWDLSSIFKTEDDYENALTKLQEIIEVFEQKYKDQNFDAKLVNSMIDDFKEVRMAIVGPSHYASLNISSDSTSEENQMRSAKFSNIMQMLSEKLSFVFTTLNEIPLEILIEAGKLNPVNKCYLDELIKDRPHTLKKEVETALVKFSQTLNGSYSIYRSIKFNDLKFSDFVVNGVNYPNSFTLFENEWEYENNKEIRHKAYESFYNDLSKYQAGLGTNYITHIKTEKAYADLKGFKSTMEYLLFDQGVSIDMMHRQIDVIFEELSPVMQKYVGLIKRVHKLDKVTYADLKISIDHGFESKISIEDAKNYVKKGLSIFGDEYMKIVNDACDNRWVDFMQNEGKSTGGFCASPYGYNSFILLNWNGQMDEVMVLAHEIGHAGHFQYANKHQHILDTRPSLYFVEAPSTTNELIVTRNLLNGVTDLRLKRWLLSVMISRTYYHNFVTHLLEAAFQREVYNALDSNIPMNYRTLNKYKLDVIKKFWGDSVDVNEYAGLTWMRQPHYFSGLYPYTYSAGLTIGTVVSKKIVKKTLDPKKWIEVLKAGGTKTPFELAKIVGVDLSTSDALKEAISFIDESVEEMLRITDILESKE